MATHFHRYAPGRALNRELMLYCDCGSQINATRWSPRHGTGVILWRLAVAALMATRLRDTKEGG